MTNREACEPCSKRKVRCDKREPCSNCRRRKADRCVYPSISTTDRIKRLEALVRRLGGDPSTSDIQPQHDPPSETTPRSPAGRIPVEQRHQQEVRSTEPNSEDSIVLQEDGQSFYLESRLWQGWLGTSDSNVGDNITSNRNPFMLRKRPHALSKVSSSHTHGDAISEYPSSQHATILWDAFNTRVEPLVRISYRWALDTLRRYSIDVELRQRLSSLENALVSAIYYISASSLSDGECKSLLQQPKSSILHRYQEVCEDSLLRTNLLCMNDMLVIKAIIFYMMASYDRLSTQSLWSLMGLTVRNAEKLGLHRDGSMLGLPPVETEERRRVWWQLQHVDLVLAIWGGMTPLTLTADWDAKIPSNIEDDDIKPGFKEMPKERKGITSMSHCRFTYWVLDQQRRILQAKQGRFTLSWQMNKSLSPESKEDVISQLEDSLNREFLQYCDPLRPLDTLLQLVARALILGFRMRTLHASAYGEGRQATEQQREALLEASMRCLKYSIAVHSQQSLKHFEWYTKGFFSWHAFMFVLVEASRENDMSKAQDTWDLLASVYACNHTLLELSEDRRKLHAAELVVAAWKTWQNKFGVVGISTPPQFVVNLEIELSSYRAKVNQEIISGATTQQVAQQSVVPITPESFMTEEDLNGVFDLDFQDIDWLYWNSME